jgi:hypothetical protein
MDLEQGFPRMWSLWGRVCVFVNQGVCRFMQWSMIVTDNLVGGMGLARYIASLWPPRIWFPSLPKASPPSWFQAEDLFSSVFFFPGQSCVLPADVFWTVGSGLDGLSPSLGAEDVFLVSGLSILGPVWCA